MTEFVSDPSLAVLALLFEREQPTPLHVIYATLNHRNRHIQTAMQTQRGKGNIKLIPGIGWVITDAGIDLLAEQE